jgi:hypothetical protein
MRKGGAKKGRKTMNKSMKNSYKKNKRKMKKYNSVKRGGGKTAQDLINKYKLNMDDLHNCFGTLDITQQLHQYEDLNQYVGEVNATTFLPRITVNTERSYGKIFSMRVTLRVEYLENRFNEQVAEFTIETDVPMTEELKNLFIIRHNGKDKLVFHPLYFLFYQGSKDLPGEYSCPSMGIHVEDEYEGLGFARNMIKLALISMQNIIDNRILDNPENNFGGPLDSQIIAIDGDGSGGFWEHIGMYEDAKSGYSYVGRQQRRCDGMEKIIPIVKMYNWAFFK